VGVRLSRISNARWDRIALIAIVAGAVIRAAWVLSLHPPLDHVYSDMGGYVDRAVKLASGGGIDRYDAFYPPGTHWLLAVPLFIFGTDRTGLWAGAVLWWALSAFTPLAMWRFTRHHLTIPAAALTAIFVAFWPLHIAYSGYFLSETPSIALLVGSLWLAARAAAARSLRGSVGAGVLGGLAVANRPALIANLVVAIVSIPRTTRVRALQGIGVGAAAVLAIVILHNSVAAGKLTLTSENSGLTFWIGHCDVHAVRTTDPRTGAFFEFSSPPAFQRGSGKDYAFTDHMVWDQDFFYAMAFDCIRQDGIAHLRTLARGVFDMTLTSVPWPMAVEGDLGARIGMANALFSITLPAILIGAVWLIRERRRRREPAGEAVMLAHFACVLLTAVLFFGDPRYRQPYDLFALALAAALIAYFFVGKRARATETSPLLDG
jgi:4-amino-4-deoxy-L-arabinose transferase-like glycosyltransferase